MGTRGAIGFRINEQDKIMYNHFDSYPDGVGVDVVEFARLVAENISEYREKVNRLQAVDSSSKPSNEILEKAKDLEIVDIHVGSQSLDDWYCVLRGTQGKLHLTLEIGVFVNAAEFLKDSLFCEYAYIINLDHDLIEFYRGFNKDKHAAGRYAYHESDNGYAGCKLVGVFPISSIPDDWEKVFE